MVVVALPKTIHAVPESVRLFASTNRAPTMASGLPSPLMSPALAIE